MTELLLSDFRLPKFGSFTEDSQQTFSIKEGKIRPYEYRDNVHLSITYEFSLDMLGVERSVYNVLDWLGDVGGLFDALLVIGGFILFIRHAIRGDAINKYLL